MAKEIFQRHELKYFIPYSQYLQLLERLKPYTRYDKYGDEEGRYTIISLYFDSEDYQIYYETRNKNPFRQKLRLRIYNDASLNDQAFFEIKQKFKNVVNKRRTFIKLEDAYNYLAEIRRSGQSIDLDNLVNTLDISNPQIMREIDAFRQHYSLKPEVVVSYDRQALQGVEDQDLRITFDFNLTCRNTDLHIEHGPYGELFVPKDMVILEVKVSHSVPLWLTRILSELECERRSVSKYCTSIETLVNPTQQAV